MFLKELKMPYYISINDNFYESVIVNPYSHHILKKPVSSFPSSFIDHMISIDPSINRQDLQSQNYFPFQNDFRFPKIFSFNYIVKKSSDFFDHVKTLISPPDIKTDDQQIYPIAVRYTNGKNLWVIERPPFKATITYRATRSNSTSEKYRQYTMWMPWTVMVLNIDFVSNYYDSYLFFNDSSLQSFDDQLVPCFFPNIYADGRMCLNQTYTGLQQYLYETQSFNVASVYNYIMNDYMSGGWNLDLGASVFDRYIPRSLSSNLPNIKKLYDVIINGDKSIKVKPIKSNSNYNYIPYTRKLSASFAYFASLETQQMLDIISESKTQSQSNSLASIISKLENSHIDFSSLFFEFTKKVNSNFNHEAFIIIPPFVYNSITKEEDHYTAYTDQAEVFLKNLLNFLSLTYENHRQNLLNDDSYYHSSVGDSYIYVYASSIDSFHLIHENDASFVYSMESLNV